MAEPEAGGKQYPAPDLEKLKKMFDESRTLCQDARAASEIDRDYYDNAFPDTSQLTPTQRAILQGRRQPEIIANRIKPAINGILGVVVQGKTDPRAYMRNPPKDRPHQQSPAPAGGMGGPMGGAAPGPMAMAQPPLDAGDVATMTLRFIADANRFGSLKIDVLENMGIEGCGACIIEVDNDREVAVSQIRWEEFFYDPRSRKHDFSDARYMGIAKWMYADDVKKLFPKKAKEIDDAFGSGDVSGGSDTSWQDKPEDASKTPAWADSKVNRIMVVDKYYREQGAWLNCVFCSGGVLDSGPSQYVDDRGRPICAIEAQSAFVDRKNRRYGWVRDMRGPQDEINLRRIKASHEVATRQIQQIDPNTPPIDTDTARQEAARPDGVLPPGWQIVPRQDVVANNLNLLQEAKGEIERMAPTPAIIGRQNASASGRADQVKQQAGMTELARVLGRFNDWEMRCYRQMWARARQFWNEPKWIRVADDDGAPKYVMVNEPGEEQMDPMTGQVIAGPPKNHIAKMDVDIIVDSVPDTATLQQEVFGELMQLAQAYAGTPQQVPFKMAVELSSIPKKRELLQKFEQFQAEAAQAAQPQQQLQMADATTKIAKTQSETQKNVAITKKTEVEATTAAMHGAMEARAADMLPPGVSEIANLPQNKPPPGNSGART